MVLLMAQPRKRSVLTHGLTRKTGFFIDGLDLEFPLKWDYSNSERPFDHATPIRDDGDGIDSRRFFGEVTSENGSLRHLQS